ncbi:hypothetical protein [Enterocloster hominis (ex Hitch et al. 2024)]|uniref:2'-5' RNA ligase family protein n=1 Tax=Enterocloster hominis (ex Hitch et al. 2024) TaxID=1917870 RepID=A0ABV1D3R0_9FIRM
METLNQFRERVYDFEYNSLYMNHDGCFCTNSSLNDKVDASGKFKKYIGNTILFSLDLNDAKTKIVRKKLKYMQDILYSKCQGMFAERLNENTFHMTLHDLVNGRPENVVDEEICLIREKAKIFMENVCKESWIIRLKTICVFNMVHSSVVLGLEPYSNPDCDKLMDLYECLERIYPVGYQMTPHITLAYYKPGIYQDDDIKKLKEAFDFLSNETFVMEFTSESLKCQDFCDMNHYAV